MDRKILLTREFDQRLHSDPIGSVSLGACKDTIYLVGVTREVESYFLVVADGSNNTADVIDRNEFVADIYIKPSRSINFITLTFVATRTGVSFDEVIGRV